jgi:hypothetical protein
MIWRRERDTSLAIFIVFIDSSTLNKILANQIQEYIKKSPCLDVVGFIPRMVWFDICKSILKIYDIN